MVLSDLIFSFKIQFSQNLPYIGYIFPETPVGLSITTLQDISLHSWVGSLSKAWNKLRYLLSKRTGFYFIALEVEAACFVLK